MNLWKVYYGDSIERGRSRADWDALPAGGVQILVVKLDLIEGGKSRVVWYHDLDGKRLFYDVAFYAWFDGDDRPSGVTPDDVLWRWAEKTGRTDVRIGDLSLDDLASIGVKCGRSIPDEEFNAILETAIGDPEIS